MTLTEPRARFDWSLSARVTWQARRRPDKTAIISTSRSLTYAELDRRVSALAAAFLERGVAAGDRVAIVAENRVDVVTTVFALARIGAITVPVNWRLAVPELTFVAEHAGVVGFVTQDRFGDACAEVAGKLGVGWLLDLDGVRRGGPWATVDDAIAAHEGVTVADVPAEADAVQRIMYTSGTTSLPKGVMISNANVVWNCHCHMLEIELNADDVVMLGAPLFHVGGLDAATIATLYAGGTVVVADALDAGTVTELVERHRLTSLGFIPAQLVIELLRVGNLGRDLSSLRLVISGGTNPEQTAAFRAWLPQVRFANGYGMTELTSGCSYSDYDVQADNRPDSPLVLSAGRPFPYMQVRVLADDDRELGPGEVGELVWVGPKVCLGYWRDAEATAALFTSDGWLRSGDYGYVDDAGRVYFVDRKKDMLKSGGENVASAEVEAALLEHPAVAQVAVVGVPDERWGEVPKAFVVLPTGVSVDPDELKAHVADRLAKFKVPKYIEFVDDLPRNETGKVLKRELRNRPL